MKHGTTVSPSQTIILNARLYNCTINVFELQACIVFELESGFAIIAFLHLHFLQQNKRAFEIYLVILYVIFITYIMNIIITVT